MNKIIVISVLFIVILTCATIATLTIKPQMHKSIMFEQIIFKRTK